MDRPVQRTHVGTFDGGTGDSRQLADCTVDVHVASGAPADETDEEPVVIEVAATLPMTEQRIRADLPPYAAEQLCEAIEEQLPEE